jgi:hypothetical protein
LRYRWSGVRAQTGVGLPPIQSDLLGFVDRADEKPDLNGEELDIGEVDLDVADNDEPFVEHTIEDVDQPVGARRGY